MKIGIGIDTGGTCTDAVAMDLEKHILLAKGKAMTTHDDLSVGIIAAMDSLPAEYVRDAELVSLSTTLATNACLEDKGSRAKLVIFGLTDELVRRFRIDENYGIPLERVLCVDVDSSADGLRKAVPDWEALLAQNGEWLRDADMLSASELYSANNGAPCEKGFKSLMAERCGLKTACASELTDELNVIARGATAMLNARLYPVIHGFIAAVLQKLQERGCHGRVMIVRSDGSLMNADTSLEKPVETILSGPAASVLAGNAFFDGAYYLTVDMGGTTTDVSVVVGGKPVPASAGIRLGPWRTTVQGIFASPFALGGDTQIWMENGKLSLGVRRVEPLCSAASRMPEIRKLLRKMPECEHVNRFPLHEVLYLLHKPERPEIYSREENRLVSLLEKGPCLLEDLKRQAELDLYYFSTERLESEGIIMRSGLTPTDFMHLKGDFIQFDAEASMMGAKYLLRALGREITEENLSILADEVYELVEGRMYRNLVHIMLRQRYPGEFEKGLDPQLRLLIDQSWYDRHRVKNPMLHQLFGTDMALVGIGAPIHVFLPEVAEALGTACILPENAGVANAIGALQAKIDTVVRVYITQMQEAGGENYYIAHMPEGSIRYSSLKDAVAAAERAADTKAVEEAKRRGAKEPIRSVVRTNRNTALTGSGAEVSMGAFVEAEVIGDM